MLMLAVPPRVTSRRQKPTSKRLKITLKESDLVKVLPMKLMLLSMKQAAITQQTWIKMDEDLQDLVAFKRSMKQIWVTGGTNKIRSSSR